MPSAEWIRELYAYNEWANGRILAAASSLSDAELRQERPGMNGIADTLRHIASAQHGWWCFWTDTERVHLPEVPMDGVMAAVSGWLSSSHNELRMFTESLHDNDLERPFEDTGNDGQPLTFRLWEMMAHVVNHGTQHRSETAAVLTVLGRSPGDLDFCDFVELSARGDVTGSRSQ